MKLKINEYELKRAAKDTKGQTTETPGYTQIIYNMVDGGVWAVYHLSYNTWTTIDHETEIAIGIKAETTAEEIRELIKITIKQRQRELKKPGATEGLPKRWVNLINKIEI